MFDVGFTEIILILGLALLVLGPEKLPALAEKVGRWTGRARAMARQLRTQLEHEVTMEELARSKPMHTSASSTSASSTSASSIPVSPAPHQSAAEHESAPTHPGTPEHESASPATDPSTTKTTQ